MFFSPVPNTLPSAFHALARSVYDTTRHRASRCDAALHRLGDPIVVGSHSSLELRILEYCAGTWKSVGSLTIEAKEEEIGMA